MIELPDVTMPGDLLGGVVDVIDGWAPARRHLPIDSPDRHNAAPTMILEVADIRIRPGEQQAFDAAIVRGVETVIARAKGYRGHRVLRGVESPERYLLEILWDTVENHTVDFRQSAAFGEWRAIVGPLFAGPPTVEHFEVLAESGET